MAHARIAQPEPQPESRHKPHVSYRTRLGPSTTRPRTSEPRQAGLQASARPRSEPVSLPHPRRKRKRDDAPARRLLVVQTERLGRPPRRSLIWAPDVMTAARTAV